MFSSYISSIAPRPWAFMRSRARSRRYLRIRSQLTRCCQSNPTLPKFAMSQFSEKTSANITLAGRGYVLRSRRTRLPPRFRAACAIQTQSTVQQSLRDVLAHHAIGDAQPLGDLALAQALESTHEKRAAHLFRQFLQAARQ